MQTETCESLILRQTDLFSNPTARVPVTLVLDCSYSMAGNPIDELNGGVKAFLKELHQDDVASQSAEVAIVQFGTHASIVSDFASLERVTAPTIVAGANGGATSIGAGVRQGLAALDRRKAEYQQSGVDYYQPWMVVMTDGCPTDDQHIAAARELVTRVGAKKLTVFAIGIGADADMDVLAMLSPNRSPLRLKGLCFREFFTWLSKSVAAVSYSIPGEQVQLDLDGIKGWAEL